MRHKLLITIALATSVVLPTLVYAPPHALAQNVPSKFENPLHFETAEGKDAVKIVIRRLINLMLSVAVLLAVGALVWGGILYIISLGNDERTKLAKKIIISALFGLVVIILAVLIVQLVGKTLGATEKISYSNHIYETLLAHFD